MERADPLPPVCQPGLDATRKPHMWPGWRHHRRRQQVEAAISLSRSACIADLLAKFNRSPYSLRELAFDSGRVDPGGSRASASRFV